MKSFTIEEKNPNLSNLLKINLLSIRNDKLSRQKPELKLFNNTDTFNKVSPKKIKDISKPNLTTTSFYNNPYKRQTRDLLSNFSTKNKTMYSGRIPLEFIGKATLDCQKTFYTTANEDIKKNKKISTAVKSKIFNPFNNEIMNINKKEELKLKTEIKFAQNSNDWYKFKRYKSLISELRQREYEDLFTKILKLLDTQTLVFFSHENIDQNLFNQSSNKNNKNKQNNSEEEKNVLDKIKKYISIGLEIGTSIHKFVNILINELREKIDENSKLLQRGNEQELKCTHVTKEFEKLQKFCENYDITSKMYLAQARANTINNIKNLFNKKENEYKISIYKMEDEIKDLTYLLNKNKDYFTKYKEKEAEVLLNKRQRDEYKYLYNKEMQEKILQNANEKDKEEELNKKVNELEDIIDELKEEIEGNKRKEIESNAKLSKIMMILREKNENIMMLNEELQWYIREYYKKKNEIKELEKRVFKNNEKNITDEKNKEQKDKNERKKKKEKSIKFNVTKQEENEKNKNKIS